MHTHSRLFCFVVVLFLFINVLESKLLCDCDLGELSYRERRAVGKGISEEERSQIFSYSNKFSLLVICDFLENPIFLTSILLLVTCVQLQLVSMF